MEDYIWEKEEYNQELIRTITLMFSNKQAENITAFFQKEKALY